MCTGYQFDFQELRGKEHYTVNFQSLSIRSNIHCHKYIRGLYLNCDWTVQANNMQTILIYTKIILFIIIRCGGQIDK